MSLKKLTSLALMTASALILFLVEALIPLPVALPGVKIGLSCIVTTLVLFLYGWKEALAVLVVRVLLGSIITGSLSGLPYSLAGGLVSLAGMIALKPVLKNRQLWIAGVSGAILHNIGQMGAAVIITGTPEILVYLPPLILFGIGAGLLTGLCAQFLLPRLRKALKLSNTEDKK